MNYDTQVVRETKRELKHRVALSYPSQIFEGCALRDKNRAGNGGMVIGGGDY